MDAPATRVVSKTGHAAHTHTQKHTITLARTTHAHARHACSMTLGERVCVCQGVSVCVLWPPSTLSGTLSTHLHSSTCPPCRRCMSLMSSRLSHSSTCPQRNPYTRRRLRCRHSDRQPGHLVILRYKRMRAVAYTRCIALFVLLRAQHCLAVRMRWISLSPFHPRAQARFDTHIHERDLHRHTYIPDVGMHMHTPTDV